MEAEAAKATSPAERADIVRKAIVGGARFMRDIAKETGLSHGQIDRALRRLRENDHFFYSGRTGWTPPSGSS
jgi:transposase-like protein